MTAGVSLCNPHSPPVRQPPAAYYPTLMSSYVFLKDKCGGTINYRRDLLNSSVLLWPLCKGFLEPLFCRVTAWLNYSWQPGHVQVGGDPTSRSVHTRLHTILTSGPWPRSTAFQWQEWTRVVCGGFGEDVCDLPWLHMSCALQLCTLQKEETTGKGA